MFQRWDGEKWNCDCIDLNTFCPIGPGARRGLNRLGGRAIAYCVERASSDDVEKFSKELHVLFEKVKTRWPEKLCDVQVPKLNLHDVQFQLCEFDKYRRAKGGSTKGRKYIHGGDEIEFAAGTNSKAAEIYRERNKILQERKKRKKRKLEQERMARIQFKKMKKRENMFVEGKEKEVSKSFIPSEIHHHNGATSSMNNNFSIMMNGAQQTTSS